MITSWPWVESETFKAAKAIEENPFEYGSGFGTGIFYATSRWKTNTVILKDYSRRHPDLSLDELSWLENFRPGFMSSHGDLPRATIHRLFPELYSFDYFIGRVEEVMRLWGRELQVANKVAPDTRTFQKFLTRFHSPAGQIMNLSVPKEKMYDMHRLARASKAMAFENKASIWTSGKGFNYIRDFEPAMKVNFMFLASADAFPNLHRRQKNYERDAMIVRQAFTGNGFWHSIFTANESRLP